MNTPIPHDPTTLLADMDFVRGVARSLCRDADSAEDIVQETLQRSLGRPPNTLGRFAAGKYDVEITTSPPMHDADAPGRTWRRPISVGAHAEPVPAQLRWP